MCHSDPVVECCVFVERFVLFDLLRPHSHFNECVVVLLLSPYASDLTERVRARGEEKVSLCEGVDPLLLKDADTTIDVDVYPNVEATDIKNFLGDGISFHT